MQRIKQAKSVLTFHKLRLKNGTVRARKFLSLYEINKQKERLFYTRGS